MIIVQGNPRRSIEHVDLTSTITRVHVRWHLFDTNEGHLIDGQYEYLLREEEPGEPHVQAAVSLDDPDKLRRVAEDRGIDFDELSGHAN